MAIVVGCSLLLGCFYDMDSEIALRRVVTSKNDRAVTAWFTDYDTISTIIVLTRIVINKDEH